MKSNNREDVIKFIDDAYAFDVVSNNFESGIFKPRFIEVNENNIFDALAPEATHIDFISRGTIYGGMYDISQMTVDYNLNIITGEHFVLTRLIMG